MSTFMTTKNSSVWFLWLYLSKTNTSKTSKNSS